MGLFISSFFSGRTDILDEVQHGFAENDGVRIHYATLGEGPLVVMIHGFPDFWYTWRHQMKALSDQYQLVAIDLRGYNLSDHPQGVEQYRFSLLLEDVEAVIHHFGHKKAIVVGHDWGGAITWQLAMHRPDLVEKVAVLNIPHPAGLAREKTFASVGDEKGSYIDKFIEPGAHKNFPPAWLAGWVEDEEARKVYLQAFERSDIQAMLNYYKANLSGVRTDAPRSDPVSPKIKVPALIIFGTGDIYLPVAALNNSWEWTDSDLTIVTLPGAGHFVLQDASEMVTANLRMWLNR